MTQPAQPAQSSPNRHRVPWTLSEIKRANELIAKGHSRKEVAVILGRTVLGLRNYLPREKRPTRPHKCILQEMIADGATRQEMADTLKVNKGTIHRWMVRYNLSISRRGPVADPYVRARLLDLIQQGYTSRGELCEKMQRTYTLIWRWLVELMEHNLVTKTGRGRMTRYHVTKEWGDGADV